MARDEPEDRLHRLSVAVLEVHPIVVPIAALATSSIFVWMLSSGALSAVEPYQSLVAVSLAFPTFALFADVLSFATGRKMPYAEALWG